MPFRIERLEREHIKDAARVLASAYSRPPWNENWSLDAAIENLTYVLETPRSLALAAMDGGNVLGITLGIKQRRPTGPVIYLDELSVLPEMQGKGIGTALLASACETARTEGCENIWLISKRRGALSKFYERGGFRISHDLALYSRSC
jgi:predicted N-acetyltransferase YhbS